MSIFNAYRFLKKCGYSHWRAFRRAIELCRGGVMEKRTVYYVIFLAPGSFVGEEWTETVDSPDPNKVKWPDNAYAFRMFEREDVFDGETDYQGKPKQVGPIYYHPNSAIQSLDEVRTNPRATPTLISNMEINGWKQIIWSRWGNWPQPFEPDRMTVLRRK